MVYLKELQELLSSCEQSAEFNAAVSIALQMILDTIKCGGKLLIAGNGGSAAQASHFACELVGRFEKERRGLPAISLTSDASMLTAWSNDYSFETVFARQLTALGRTGDLFIGLSTSGNSKNIIKAVEQARYDSIQSLCLLGKDGGALKGKASAEILIPHKRTSHIQELHLALIHMFCEEIEKNIV